VHVLDHDDRLSGRAQLAEERVEDGLGAVAGRDDLLETASDHPADVHERPERAWRAQPVARPDEDPPALRTLRAERADERALPDPRVARDEDEAAFAAPRRGERLLERRERAVALEQPGAART
jgi:hypothetical protein